MAILGFGDRPFMAGAIILLSGDYPFVLFQLGRTP
jgi:hypothetical protein